MKRFGAFISALMLAAFVTACSSTDAGITTKVKSKFAADDTVKAYQINVDTQKGVVTLTGDVETPAAKMQAVQIARSTEGVQDVIDQLHVNRTEATSGLRDDANEIGNDLERGAEKTGNAIESGAEKTGDAIKRGAEATYDATKNAGRKVVGAVTDNDRDSDNDGK
jgi:hypothetical protein